MTFIDHIEIYQSQKRHACMQHGKETKWLTWLFLCHEIMIVFTPICISLTPNNVKITVTAKIKNKSRQFLEG